MILHSSTEKTVAAYIKNPPHALLITGPSGVGASTLGLSIARQLSKTVITVLPEKEETVDLEKGIISVAAVRKLYEQTRTKIDSRVVVVDYAERMAATAQNAFLKLLEEPIPGTMFILVTHEPTKLLPTILSRIQRLDMLPITEQQSIAFLDEYSITDQTKRTQLLYMAEGLPAELTNLLKRPEYFEQSASIVRDAKIFLQGDTYEQLLIIHKYKDNRSGALRLLDVAMNMLRRAIKSDPRMASAKKLDQLLEVYERIAANGNIRLQMSFYVV